MKTKLLIFFLLLFTTSAFSQIVNIPDPALKAKLLIYDINQDGEIQVSEAESVTGPVYVNGEGGNHGNIMDMTGIEAFVNISELYCEYNQIISLDISQNLALEVVYCHENNMSSLQLGSNLVLRVLWCFENNLTALNLSQNTFLTYLKCGNNSISSIDISQNTLLEIFTCSNNNLHTLDVSNNTLLKTLTFAYNNIEIFDVLQNAFLEQLICYQNELTSLDVRNGHNTIISSFNSINNPNLTCVFVDDAEYSTANWFDIDPNSTFVETQEECDAIGIPEEAFLNDITFYPNPTTGLLFIENQNPNNNYQITITNSLGKVLCTQLTVGISELNISHLPQGIYYLYIKSTNHQSDSYRISTSTHKIIKL